MGKFKQYACNNATRYGEDTHRVRPNNGNPLTGNDYTPAKPQTKTTNLNAKVNASGQLFVGPDGDKYHMGGGDITNLETGNILSSKEKKELIQDLHRKV
jgi:hypothetical protein